MTAGTSFSSSARKPRLLDLFCGAGGAAMGYHRAGWDVVGVDIEPQPHYPFEFLQGDALDALAGGWPLGEFDAIHASPPCQAYSSATPAANREAHPDLVGPVRELLEAIGLPYVIENVPGAPMRTGFVLCGSMFGLKVRRHRLFESSVLISPPVCDHKRQGTPLGVYGDGGPGKSTRPSGGGGTKADRREFGALMEMPWATPKEIVQAIPPAYTEFIGHQLIARIDRAEVERDHFRDLWDGARVTEVSNVELIWVDHPLPGTGITSVRKVEANDA